ncbi:hypothetical protein Arno162_105 [Pectobacterium phage Arno162]|uniref:Uncharacterized protein n=1 Tax=Pectobacterium phage Arno162 TaxID=2500577 RepID=A0A679A2N1_9CAUD|nr:hypothetical protein Arno162_105 [Pectobacterium phage Arno162]
MSKYIKVVYTNSEGILHQEGDLSESGLPCIPRKNEVVHINSTEYYVRRVIHEPTCKGGIVQTYHRVVVELMQ